MTLSYLIAPSILAADITRLGEEIDHVIGAGADLIHLDVMDNHYVPNLTFGPVICESMRRHFPQLIIDVHLMVQNPDTLISSFAEAGANRMSIHPDSTIHLDRSLQLIKNEGCKAGIVLNPATSIDCLQWCMHHLDFVLVMTVNPGFGGQKLIPSVIHKIAIIRERYPTLSICVDGGITGDNIADIAKAGANEFVVGSAIFSNPDYRTTIADLRKKIEEN